MRAVTVLVPPFGRSRDPAFRFGGGVGFWGIRRSPKLCFAGHCGSTPGWKARRYGGAGRSRLSQAPPMDAHSVIRSLAAAGRAVPDFSSRNGFPDDQDPCSDCQSPAQRRMPNIAKPTGTQSPEDLTMLRLTGLFEAITLVVLVGVAVPLKYLFAYPAAVKILGPIHGWPS